VQTQNLDAGPREGDRVREQLRPVRQHVGEGGVALKVRDEDGRGQTEERAQRDVYMYGTVGEEPMHEGPFGGHHVGVFLRLLGSLLLGCQLGSGVARSVLAESGTVRWRVELRGFLEDEGLGALRASAFG